jgi:tetratricopeptide (TPR) repeat protein
MSSQLIGALQHNSMRDRSGRLRRPVQTRSLGGSDPFAGVVPLTGMATRKKTQAISPDRGAQRGAEDAVSPPWTSALAHRPTLWILFGLLLLGALLRGLYLSEFVHYPDFKVPHVDADFHNYWARGLAFQQWTPPAGNPDPLIRTTPFFRPPGYPYYLALIYKLTGPGYLWPRILQMILGLLNVFLAFLLASRYFGRVCGLIFAGMMSTYWIFIFFEGEFQEPVLMVLLVLLAAMLLMDWADRRRPLQALIAGVLIGLAGLIRPNSLLLLPAVLLWMAWILWRRTGRIERRTLGVSAGAVLLAAFLVILPATLRNWIVAHDFVPISSNGGINLYIGNNERADGIVRGALPDIGVLDTCYDWPEIVGNIERKLGRSLTHSEVSDYFTRGALRWMEGHPLRVVGLLWRKTLLFWGPLEPQDNKEVDEDRKAAPVLRFLPWSFALALGLGAAGLIIYLWERRRGRAGRDLPRPGEDRSAPAGVERQWELVVLLLLVVLVWYVSYLPFAVCSRYRVPVIPVLLLLGAFLLQRLVRRLAEHDYRTSGIYLGALAVCLIPAHINFARYENSPARWHYQRGSAYIALGRPTEAMREFQEAIRYDPGYVSVYNDLGATLASGRRYEESIPYFRESIRLEPGNPQAHSNLAAAYEVTGRLEQSLAEYQEALRWKPGYTRAAEGIRRVSQALAGRGTSPAPGGGTGQK